MDDELDVFNLQSDEFRFLDYPNTFLSNDKYEDGDLNKSANTQLEEKLNELIKETSVSSQTKNHQLNGVKSNSYLDELNDLKELKRMEDKKSYQQTLDRLSKLNLTKSSNYRTTNYSSSNYTSSYPSNLISNFSSSSNHSNPIDRRLTQKFENKSLRVFKSNNHLTVDDHAEIKNEETSKFDSTFDLRNVCENNDQTFVLDKLLNLSSDEHADQQNDVNNTFMIAKNYDDVQEIARKQEAVLKKNVFQNRTPTLPTSPTINNATMIKAKKNGHHNILDQNITLKHLLNENSNDCVKSPNLDGTFNLGNPIDCQLSTNNGTATIKKEKSLPNSRSFILNPKTLIKRPNAMGKNGSLDSKNNRLNSSFIVGDINEVKQSTDREDVKKINLPNFNQMPSSNQFSTITKNKINQNLKRTNTFKVRESFQYASEENLTFAKNGLSSNFITKSGLNMNNYPSIDDMKNYETIKLRVSKLNSKSNGHIGSIQPSNDQLIQYKTDSKPSFTSRLKAPSRLSVMKNEEI